MALNERAEAIPSRLEDDGLFFNAFGKVCVIKKDGITLDGLAETGPRGIVISLYALRAADKACTLEPFKAFKELPDSMPYAAAFTNRTEHALTAVVDKLPAARDRITTVLDGGEAPAHMSGDLSFIVRPLPKIVLCYVCYAADEDFPAAVTCLYSNNVEHFMPTDGLADLGEYTTKAIIDLLI